MTSCIGADLKGFVDGSLGSTTAWFYKPYLDAPGKTGLQVTDPVYLRKWILSADSAGLHIATHAIGDRANDWILDVYEEAEKKNPGRTIVFGSNMRNTLRRLRSIDSLPFR